MKIYISGPMTGIENLNADAFFNMERSIIANGETPVNPHRISRELQEAGVITPGMAEKEMYNLYLRADIEALMKCDVIIMLEGWQESKGAIIEFSVARMVGIDVRYEI